MHFVLIIGFVLLLIAFPRQIGAIILLGIVGVVVLVGLYVINGNQRAEAMDKLLEKVRLSIAYAPGRCSAEYPLEVTTENLSRDTSINEIWFAVGASQPRHSNLLVKSDTLRSDRIIPPGERYTNCWKTPFISSGVDPAGLEWAIGKRGGKFSKN